MDTTLTLAVIPIVYLVVVVIRWGINRRKNLQLLDQYGIPGPKPDFFRGNMHQLRKHLSTPNDTITEWIKEYGNVFGYYYGGVPYVVVNDLDMLRKIMIKDFHIFENRPEMLMKFKPVDTSLLALKSKRWKEIRSQLTPTFSSGKIKLMTEIIRQKVDITTNQITKKVEKQEMFDIYELVQGLTLDVIADCAFAMKTNCQENCNDPFLIAVRQFMLYSHNKAIDYANMFPFVATLMSFVCTYLTAGKMATLIVQNVRKTIRIRQNNPNMKRIDLLQLMLENSKKDGVAGMTEDEIIGNAYIFLLGGYETTATVLALTFYLLTAHPEIQERLYEEVNSAKDCTYNTLQSLQYLDQVLNESLRLYPPVTGFITRACSKDYRVGQFTLPKGVQMFAPVWDIHHNPEFWPDPWKFDPDRFSPVNKGSIDSLAYIPFGIGPRSCVGARFALLEAKLAIFNLLKKFKFEMCELTDHPIHLTCPTVMINPENGVWLKASLRNLEETY